MRPLLPALVLLLPACAAADHGPEPLVRELGFHRVAPDRTLRGMTPVVIVERIEPELAFWVDRLGFAVTAEVPEEEHIGFAILARDGVELMLQTWTSVQADEASVFTERPRDHTPLFVEVADIQAVRAALAGADLLVAERETFYGSLETIARTPCGLVVTFAEFPAQDE